MKIHHCLLLIICFILAVNPRTAQADNPPPAPYLVKDTNSCTESSEPGLLGEKDGMILFTVTTQSGLVDLWKTDGTEAGTQRITNLGDDKYWSLRTRPIWMNEYMYFFGSNTYQRFTLWRTDGTEAGTQAVQEIELPYLNKVTDPVIVGETLYFIIVQNDYQGPADGALWQSDGTEAGTHPIKALTFPSYLHNPKIVAFQDRLFFSANDDQDEQELWVSDGTEAGTHLFANLNPNGPSSPSSFLVSASCLFFQARNEQDQTALWQTDGTPAGTKQISSIVAPSYEPMVYWKETLYFAGSNQGDGYRLWRTDGTEAGTRMVKDIPLEVSIKWQVNIGVAGDHLYFGANQSELWRTDGTEAGTVRIKDLWVDEHTYYTPYQFYEVQGSIYFTARLRGESPIYLWRTNGTEAGTIPAINGAFPDRYVFVDGLIISHNQLFFADFGSCTGQELMRIVDKPGQLPRSELIKDIETKTMTSEVRRLVSYRGSVYFAADNHFTGRELWTSDGTEAGTYLLKDIVPGRHRGALSPEPELVPAAGYLFFSARDEKHEELWRTNGTEAGTQRVRDLGLDSDIWGPHQLVNFEDSLFFFQEVGGVETLWVTNGEASGTTQLAEFPGGLRGSRPVIFKDHLYFLVGGYSGPQMLYRTDGTPQGTEQIYSGDSRATNSPGLVRAGSRLYFAAWDAQHGQELWQSDGTAEGTKLHSDVTPGPASTNIVDIAGTNTALVFSSIVIGSREVTEWSLWKAGPAVGTLERLMASQDYPDTGWVMSMISSASVIYFTLGDGYPESLWKTDGTKAGTLQLTAHIAGIDNWTLIGDTIYFSSGDDQHGVELWVSDGTPESTRLLFDLRPGPDSSGPASLTFTGGKLWFIADDGLHGQEPWVYDWLTEDYYFPIMGR